MEDRVPTPGKEGRVLITPEDGSPSFYAKIEMADSPTQKGTPFNKASMLQDATAAMFDLDASAVPNDVFSWLGSWLSTYNSYWWRRRTNSSYWNTVIAQATLHTVVFASSSYGDGIIQYSDTIAFDSFGVPSLVSPQSFTYTKSTQASSAEILKGKFFAVTKNNYGSGSNPLPSVKLGVVYFVPSTVSDFENMDLDHGQYLQFSCGDVTGTYVEVVGDWTYVQSTNRTAYPDSGVVDGYEYRYLGVPYQNAVNAPIIDIGVYVGTGTYGQSSPNSITCNFPPDIVWIVGYSASDSKYTYIQGYNSLIVADTLSTEYKNDMPPQMYNNGSYTVYTKKSEDGKTISWYSTSAGTQLNVNGNHYFYIAISAKGGAL